MSLPRRLLLGAALGTPFIARAQGGWPQRPVRWVVAFAAGGAADTAARSAAARAQEIIGQSIVIENRTGGNAVIAAQARGCCSTCPERSATSWRARPGRRTCCSSGWCAVASPGARRWPAGSPERATTPAPAVRWAGVEKRYLEGSAVFLA